jgi:hypothetical protein
MTVALAGWFVHGAGWHSGNIQDVLASVLIEAPVIMTEDLRGLPHTLQAIAEKIPGLCRDRVVLNPFELIIHMQ